MLIKPNVCIKSNVYSREKNTTVWQDVNFLHQINDADLLSKYESEFKKGDQGRNIGILFSENQLDLIHFGRDCIKAPKGLKTYGFAKGPNGEKVVVCRCPLAENGPCEGKNEWAACHKRFARIDDESAILPVAEEKVEINVPEAPPLPPPPIPPSPDENEFGESGETPKTDVPKGDDLPKDIPPEKTPEDSAQNVALPQPRIAYPDALSFSCYGYDIKGERVRDGGYEIRISSGGVFIANVNSFGVVLGKHPKLVIEELSDKGSLVSFDNFEKMSICLQQEPTPVVDIAIGFTKISACVK